MTLNTFQFPKIPLATMVILWPIPSHKVGNHMQYTTVIKWDYDEINLDT